MSGRVRVKAGMNLYCRYEEVDARFTEYYGQLWSTLNTPLRRKFLCDLFAILPVSVAQVEARMRAIMSSDREGAEHRLRASRNERAIH